MIIFTIDSSLQGFGPNYILKKAQGFGLKYILSKNKKRLNTDL